MPGDFDFSSALPEANLPEGRGDSWSFGDSMTRRQFILRTSAGSASLIMAPRLFGEPTTAVEISDTIAGAVPVTLKINGENHTLHLDPRVTLLDALRERLDLTGTKKGCDHGQCGACTVLKDGRRINSCLILAIMCQGAEIKTIEGLADGEKLHPVQAAFLKHDAFQCGYCTPGQICSAVGLIAEGHAKSDDDIRELMSGNICRCGAYQNIVAAVREAQANS